MNGLQGRMLTMPAPKGRSREILMLYGHHSTLERWFGLAQVLNRYGAVTMPDLPGFGGMDSFYKIDQKPTLDNLADYLAAFIKMRYKRRRITLVGMSFGFVVVTRMLQKFPDLAKRVDVLVSLVGFVHKDDFALHPLRFWAFRNTPRLLKLPPFAYLFREVGLRPWVLRLVYTKMGHAKFSDLTPEQAEEMLQVEIRLWRDNDVRTYMYTTIIMFTLDNCRQRVNLPVWHVAVKHDHFFNNDVIEQHMLVTFTGFEGMKINLTKHAPTVIADAKDAEPFIPAKLRRLLAKQ